MTNNANIGLSDRTGGSRGITLGLHSGIVLRVSRGFPIQPQANAWGSISIISKPHPFQVFLNSSIIYHTTPFKVYDTERFVKKSTNKSRTLPLLNT
jgi:hypothetical protein